MQNGSLRSQQWNEDRFEMGTSERNSWEMALGQAFLLSLNILDAGESTGLADDGRCCHAIWCWTPTVHTGGSASALYPEVFSMFS
ncbi:hypothetical protein GOBAR_AA30958 [Gossypium barbadense]|uniref:Uncharacterized protein n=1 Tax=Gossypium barbadense TaxID=3634 RepID=A0A2P5WF39_GOSBA|nr:hypothetical protein GOBAR_AA30958 [Gossypium barbadense]